VAFRSTSFPRGPHWNGNGGLKAALSNHAWHRQKRKKPATTSHAADDPTSRQAEKKSEALPRRPTPDERAEMHRVLDRFVEDERRLREAHRTPNYGRLYDPEIVACVENCIDGRPIDPELMWFALDSFDRYHRQVDATPREYAQERRAMRALMQQGAA
jgi:hypothetical protein